MVLQKATSLLQIQISSLLFVQHGLVPHGISMSHSELLVRSQLPSFVGVRSFEPFFPNKNVAGVK